MKKIILLEIFFLVSQIGFGQDSVSYQTSVLRASEIKDTSRISSRFIIHKNTSNDGKSKILGKINDFKNGQILPGSGIYVTGTKLFSVADSLGNFLFDDIPSGNYTIKVAYVGYQSIETVLDINKNETIVIDFLLVEELNNTSELFEVPTLNHFSVDRSLEYELLKESQVDISVYDGIGRLIRTLLSTIQTKGEHKLNWDCKDDTGNIAKEGIYYIHISVDGSIVKRKKILFAK